MQAAQTTVDEPDVVQLSDVNEQCARDVLRRFGLTLVEVATGLDIPGSFWGDREAGVIAERVYARPDTPLHSLLHEASHLIVLPVERRRLVHTNATDSDIEEDATCYLQILLADAFTNVGRTRLMTDMDAWGYSFRLGSAQAWFVNDAEDARRFLIENRIIDDDDRVLALG